jgi:hypothetical protein
MKNRRYNSNCLCPELIDVMGYNKYKSAAICDEAGRQKISNYPIIDVVGQVGGLVQAQYEYRADVEPLKRTYNQRGDNSPASSEKSNPGVVDKKYNLSNYQTVSECASSLESLGVDSDRASLECNSYFDNGKMSDKNTVSGNHLLQTVKTSKTLQVHNAANRTDIIMDSIKIGQSARAKDGSDIEPEVPAWAQTMIGGPPNLIKSSSTNRIKSASEQQKDQMYAYMRAKQITHRDDVNGVPYNEEMEQLIHERGEYLNDIAEILDNRKIKSGKVEKKPNRYEGVPAWAICSGLLD